MEIYATVMAAAIVLAVLTSFVFIWRTRDYPSDKFMVSVMAIIFGIAAFAFMVILPSSFSDRAQSFGDRPLKSLNAGSSLHGSFFLGSGTVNDEAVYFFYVKDDIGYRLLTVGAAESRIIETSAAPHVECFITGQPYVPLVGWDIAEDIGGADYCNFYIPEGSVKDNFNPNMGDNNA